MDPSVTSSSTECSTIFDQLNLALQEPRGQENTSLNAEIVQDEGVRFKLWAGNLGTIQWPDHSPTYGQLRQSKKLVDQLLESLKTLSSTLKSSESG